MINIRYISQQLELTFWNVAIESMSAARQMSRKIFLAKIARRVSKEAVIKTLAVSGLGGSLGFLIGFVWL